MLRPRIASVVYISVLLGSSVLIPLAVPRAAHAAAPSNDNFVSAEAIPSLPFSASASLDEATTEIGEPTPQCLFQVFRTVWYTFVAPSDGTVQVASENVFSSSLALYAMGGPTFGDLTLVTCGAFNSPVAVFAQVQAGSTYAIQLANAFDFGGTFALSVEMVPPPPNDDFAAATAIDTLPFLDSENLAAATTETGEPTDCSFGDRTIWYSLSPQTSGSLTARANAGSGVSLVAWQGTELANLALIDCAPGPGTPLTIHVDAGQTYYYQVWLSPFGNSTGVDFIIDVAPDPQPFFFYSPQDPSRFDEIQFFDFSSDPAGTGIVERSWTFGDGSTASDQFPVHRYPSDGDYTVELTVVTEDGRTASTSQVVSVSTHDVVIARFTVPTSANQGQTRPITVGIADRNYAESVQVELFRSTPQGYALIDTLTMQVPVRSGNRTTNFTFNYSFTADDAALGKVTFRAVATILGARDALPADNEQLATTKVAH